MACRRPAFQREGGRLANVTLPFPKGLCLHFMGVTFFYRSPIPCCLCLFLLGGPSFSDTSTCCSPSLLLSSDPPDPSSSPSSDLYSILFHPLLRAACRIWKQLTPLTSAQEVGIPLGLETLIPGILLPAYSFFRLRHSSSFLEQFSIFMLSLTCLSNALRCLETTLINTGCLIPEMQHHRMHKLPLPDVPIMLCSPLKGRPTTLSPILPLDSLVPASAALQDIVYSLCCAAWQE